MTTTCQPRVHPLPNAAHLHLTWSPWKENLLRERMPAQVAMLAAWQRDRTQAHGARGLVQGQELQEVKTKNIGLPSPVSPKSNTEHQGPVILSDRQSANKRHKLVHLQRPSVFKLFHKLSLCVLQGLLGTLLSLLHPFSGPPLKGNISDSRHTRQNVLLSLSEIVLLSHNPYKCLLWLTSPEPLSGFRSAPQTRRWNGSS